MPLEEAIAATSEVFSQSPVSLDRESRAVLIVPSSFEAFDLQAVNVFEMPAIVSEERSIVLKGRDADHEIEIRNALALGT